MSASFESFCYPSCTECLDDIQLLAAKPSGQMTVLRFQRVAFLRHSAGITESIMTLSVPRSHERQQTPASLLRILSRLNAWLPSVPWLQMFTFSFIRCSARFLLCIGFCSRAGHLLFDSYWKVKPGMWKKEIFVYFNLNCRSHRMNYKYSMNAWWQVITGVEFNRHAATQGSPSRYRSNLMNTAA